MNARSPTCRTGSLRASTLKPAELPGVLDADRLYDAAFARAYMAYSGPAHAKRYAAELETTEEREARDVADAAYRYTDRRTRAYQDELRSLQSINKSVLMAYQTAGVGER